MAVPAATRDCVCQGAWSVRLPLFVGVRVTARQRGQIKSVELLVKVSTIGAVNPPPVDVMVPVYGPLGCR